MAIIESTGKRLAKNTAYMYFRMIVLMLISLYTSRVVLQQLGVEDYGIYNLVGSIVMMLSSLRTSFSSSTQRFLNFEMGKGDLDKLHLIYNQSLLINFTISLFFILLAEIIGIWFLENKANIDDSRFFAAHIVFQLSIIASVVNLVSTTFDAIIIAHERMSFYAYFTVLQGAMNLMMALLLAFIEGDKLIYYGFFMLGVPVTTLVVSYMYCRKYFDECRFDWSYDTSYLKQMLGFAGWNFMGNTAYALTHNGLNMVLNVFGGAVVNAARGIAYQVNSVTYQFLNNINIVIVPYSIKTYAEGEKNKAFEFMFFSSKILFAIQLFLVVVLVFLTPYIIRIWLGIIPDYVVVFIRIILVYSLIRSLHAPIDTLFKAEGNLKYYQTCEIIILMMPLITSVLALKMGFPYCSVFVLMIIFEIINLVINLLLLKRIVGFNIISYTRKVLLHCASCFVICLFFFIIADGKSLIICCLSSFLAISLSYSYMFIMGFSKQERSYIIDVVSRTIYNKNKK